MVSTTAYLVIISIFVLLFLLILGTPIFVSLGLVGIVGIMLLNGFNIGLALLRETPYALISEYLLVVIPLFIFMGHLAFHAGATSHAFDIARKWLSKLPAGLALATIAASAAMGAACGSSVAAAATLGRVAIPEMRASGYDNKIACGCVAAGGLLAIMIPPSIILVLYGIFTDTSVGACLIGGLIPGIISTIVFMLGMSILFWINPKIAPPTSVGYSWKERFSSLKSAWGIVVLFTIVIGGMYAGFFTPTEAASGGAFGALVMLIAKKTDVFKKLKDSLIETVRTSVFIFMIMICAGLYSQFLIRAGVGTTLSNWIVSLEVSPLVVVLLVLCLYVPLGCFLDNVSILLITLPIVHPIVVKELGFNSVWFGILVTKLVEIALITPPVGINVYTIAGVAPDVPITDIFKGSAWFILFEIISLVLLIAFPTLSTWLPSMMIK
jgi:tripartite ATP-independent transporter DctM subunit